MRPYIVTIVLAVIALALTLPVHAGFMIFFFAPFIAVSLIYNVVLVIRKPDKKRIGVVRIVVWLAVPIMVGALHWYWFEASRADANMAVNAILEFKAKEGSWPTTLADAGVSEQGLEDRWLMGYLLTDKGPFFVYAATFVMFETYTYDFSGRTWVFNPD